MTLRKPIASKGLRGPTILSKSLTTAERAEHEEAENVEEIKDGLPNRHKAIDSIVDGVVERVDTMVSGLREETTKAFDERDTELCDRLDKQIAEMVDGVEKQIAEVNRKHYPPGLATKEEAPEFNWAKAARAIYDKNPDLAPVEWEQMETMRKQLATSPDSAGGYLVPEIHSDQIIDRLRASNVLFQLGITEITTGTGFPLNIPKLLTSVSAAWEADENTTISDSDATFGEVVLTPKSLRSLSKMSYKLIENSAPVASQVVEDDMVRQFGNALDLAGLDGQGGNAPTGVITEALNSQNFGGANPTNSMYSNLVGQQLKVAEDDAMTGNLGYALTPAVLADIMLAENETNLDIQRRILSEAPITQIMGFPYYTTTQLPSGAGALSGNIIFGNWADLLLGRWTSLMIRTSDVAGTSFEMDQFWIRGIMRADFAVRHGESFCISTNYGA